MSEEKPGSIILPLSDSHPFKVAWDLLLLVGILISSITIPYELTFGFYKFDFIYWTITLLFTADIFINWNTSIQKGLIQIFDRKNIGRNYLRTWFSTDVLSALPMLFIFSSLGVTSVAVLKILHALRLLRLFKIFKIKDTAKRIALQINPSIIRLLVFFIWFVLLVHFLALGWVLVGARFPEAGETGQYFLSLYWTITTITGVGYGDIVPDKGIYAEVLYTVLVELAGVGLFGYIIGNISSLVTNIDMTRASYQKKMEEIDAFFRNRKVPRELHQRVRNYYTYLWETRRSAELTSVISNLPPTLQIEISIFLNRDVIKKVSLFQNVGEGFIHELVMMLKPLVYLPGDMIIQQGEYGDCMYFLSSGSVEVIVNDIVVAELSSGSPFGEGALYVDKKRNASIRAIGYCDLYKLDESDFDKLRTRYPEFDLHVAEMVAARKKDTEEKTAKL